MFCRNRPAGPVCWDWPVIWRNKPTRWWFSMIMAEPTARQNPESPAPVEEEALVGRARRGDLAAYDELVQRYQERIYATIYHMTANHEDSSDLAQESFI